DAETKITIAQMTAQAAEKPAVSVQIEGENHLQKVGDEVKMMADQAARGLTDNTATGLAAGDVTGFIASA
ncbi:MAG: hypothetical protein ING36_06985, partial [Burkholderiales bacterium]|nr:hypothetical protein [Burkholderiales bacterium]